MAVNDENLGNRRQPQRAQSQSAPSPVTKPLSTPGGVPNRQQEQGGEKRVGELCGLQQELERCHTVLNWIAEEEEKQVIVNNIC